MRILVWSFLIILLLSSVGFAQEYYCGDANYDGICNISDAIYIFNYLFAGGPPTINPDPAFADWDGAQFLTIRDVEACIHYSFGGENFPECGYDPAAVPIVDSNVVLLYTNRVRPGETTARINLTLYAVNSNTGIEFPLSIRVNDAIPTIDSIAYFPGHSSIPVFLKNSVVYPESGEIAIGCSGYISGYQLIDQVGTIYFSVPEYPEERPITVDWTRLTPIQALVTDTNCIYPMIASGYLSHEPYEPVLTPTCCIEAGDANDDGQTNVGDAVFIISYVFKDGPVPYCMSQADANIDGDANVGDAVYLINYVFRGGPAPICSKIE